MENKKCWAIIISLFSLAIAITTAAFLICKNLQFGVEIDEGATFIGICTSLIGIFATIILGLQIWNHLEFSKVKDDVKCLELLKKEVEEAKADITGTRILINGVVSDTFSALSDNEADYNYKLCYCIQALLFVFFFEDIDDHNYAAKVRNLETGYKNIMIILDKVDSIAFSENIIEQFKNKAQSYPNNIPNYSKIMKMHFDIVSKIEKLPRQ